MSVQLLEVDQSGSTIQFYHAGVICLNELQICHHREPTNRYAGTEDHPDIVFFDLESGHDIELDISLAHPQSLDTIRQAGEKNGYDAS